MPLPALDSPASISNFEPIASAYDFEVSSDFPIANTGFFGPFLGLVYWPLLWRFHRCPHILLSIPSTASERGASNGGLGRIWVATPPGITGATPRVVPHRLSSGCDVIVVGLPFEGLKNCAVRNGV